MIMEITIIILSIIIAIQTGLNVYLATKLIASDQTVSDGANSITSSFSQEETSADICWQCRNTLGTTIGCEGCEEYIEPRDRP